MEASKCLTRMFHVAPSTALSIVMMSVWLVDTSTEYLYLYSKFEVLHSLLTLVHPCPSTAPPSVDFRMDTDPRSLHCSLITSLSMGCSCQDVGRCLSGHRASFKVSLSFAILAMHPLGLDEAPKSKTPWGS